MTARDRLDAALGDLRAQIIGLEADIAGIVAASEASNADDEHDPDGATIAFERAQVAALLDAARTRQAEVLRALASVDDPAFGRCADCGAPIGDERMAARPGVSRCVDCARRAAAR